MNDQLLTEIENTWPKLGLYLRSRVLPSINATSQAAGISSQAPDPPSAVNVKVSGETAHITLNHDTNIQRGVNYFVELSSSLTSPSAPHVEDLGASRGKFINLPTMDDGGNTHTWSATAYAQYSGSQPSARTNPTTFQMAGNTRLTPLASTGSGTASGNGQQSGWGMGKTVYRQAAPKRGA